MKLGTKITSHILIPLILSSLQWCDKAVGFPHQAAFTVQVENEDNLLLHRPERSARLDDDEFSGDTLNLDSVDGQFLDSSPAPVKIGSLHIVSTTTARFTNTSITSKLVNNANISQETEVVLRLPEEAFITELFIEVDGKTYRSSVETKENAQKIYDTARERGQTASQVKQKSEKTNDFSVSINVARLGVVKCTLIYQQLLVRKKGYFENKISIRPNQIVADLKVNVYITEPQGLDEVSAWLQKERGNDYTPNELTDRHVDFTTTRAHVQFSPSKAEQLAQSEHGIIGDFVIKYDVIHGVDAGNIQVVNGYFVHHFSPEGIPHAKKNVVFVIDVSGSMSGIKIEQTREALLTILDELKEGDTFNIVTFHTTVSTWQPETMIEVTPKMIEMAKNFTQKLRPLHSTDLHNGIQTGVSLLENYHSPNINHANKSLSMLIVLSDGLPTTGITNLNYIKEHTKDKIDGRYSLFTLGFGDNVDDVFLEKLAGQNSGIFRKIYVDSASRLQLEGFFEDVATPLLFNVQFRYSSGVIDNNSVTQTAFPSYFQGSELVVAGKLLDNVDNITANVIGGTSEHGVLGIKVVGSIQLSEKIKLSPHVVGNFTQRLWAYLTIKELLRKRTISDDTKMKDDLEKRALKLSLRYHFVTPLTSLVVVKPDSNNATNDETVDRVEKPDVQKLGSTQNNPSSRMSPSYIMMRPSNLMSQPIYYHTNGISRKAGIASADSDPHFVLHVPNGNVTICFNIMANPGDVLNLIKDTEMGLSIDAKVQAAVSHPELLKKKNIVTSDFLRRTIFEQMEINTLEHRILISSQNISIDNLTMPWGSDWSMVNNNFSVEVNEAKYLYVQIQENVQLIVMRHTINKNHPGKSDYLGLYVEKGDGFSRQVHGLIGQFQRSTVHLYSKSVHTDNHFDTSGILRVKNRTVKVKHASREIMLTGDVVTCWFAANNGYGLIDGHYTDYLQNSM